MMVLLRCMGNAYFEVRKTAKSGFQGGGPFVVGLVGDLERVFWDRFLDTLGRAECYDFFDGEVFPGGDEGFCRVLLVR